MAVLPRLLAGAMNPDPYFLTYINNGLQWHQDLKY
jgi:hypothetical protein